MAALEMVMAEGKSKTQCPSPLYPSIHPPFPHSPMAPFTINATTERTKQTETPKSLSRTNRTGCHSLFPPSQAGKQNANQSNCTTSHDRRQVLPRAPQQRRRRQSPKQNKKLPSAEIEIKAIQNPCRKRSQRRHTVLVSPWAHWEGWIAFPGRI